MKFLKITVFTLKKILKKMSFTAFLKIVMSLDCLMWRDRVPCIRCSVFKCSLAKSLSSNPWDFK